MKNPDDLLDALVATFKDIPDLVAAFVSADNIRSYVHDFPTDTNRFLAIYEAKPPCLLVCYSRTEIQNRSRGIAHHFSAYLKPDGQIGAAFLALRDGVVTSSGDKLKVHQIDLSCHPPDVQGCIAQTQVISEQILVDYFEVPIVLTERGADI